MDRPFSIEDLAYDLPEELIAQEPTVRREQAKLLVVDRATQSLSDRSIADLADLLAANDLLVLNNTRVVPAKLEAFRQSGGRIPGIFVTEKTPGVWQVMLQGAKRLQIGETLTLTGPTGKTVCATILEKLEQGHWLWRVDTSLPAYAVLENIGYTPLPPYIKRGSEIKQGSEKRHIDDKDKTRYQTVYAKVPGAVAAPTAGLHITDALLEQLNHRGVDTAFVTLHVGLGTFKPITTDRLEDHAMHSEWYDLPIETASAINHCHKNGGRTVAVGTTSVRTLESAYLASPTDSLTSGGLQARSDETTLFAYPPFQFNVVDALLTNFHLPRSTLLALIMAFAGIELTQRAYQHAIEHRYRFFSYGDAMLIV